MSLPDIPAICVMIFIVYAPGDKGRAVRPPTNKNKWKEKKKKEEQLVLDL